MSPSTKLQSRDTSAGFTLIEVLVALAVLAVSLTAIGSLVATNIRATRALDQRLALAATARAILTGLPDREEFAVSNSSGEIAGGAAIKFCDANVRGGVAPSGDTTCKRGARRR